MVLQKTADTLATTLLQAETTLHPDATILEGFERSPQLNFHGCGISSCIVILRYFGKRISAASLARKLRTDYSGTAPSNLKRVLRKYGLKVAERDQMRIRDLKGAIEDGSPVLISTQGHMHYATVFGIGRRVVFVSDSVVYGSVRCAWSKEEFRGTWTRWGLIVSRRS